MSSPETHSHFAERVAKKQPANRRHTQSGLHSLVLSLSLFFAVHPLIQVPNQLVGAPTGTDVTLQCHVEASPKAINYWTRENGKWWFLQRARRVHQHKRDNMKEEGRP